MTWDDSSDKSFRPDADTFASMAHLYKGEGSNKVEITDAVKTVNESGNQYIVTWSNMPVNDNGTKIVYSVSEDVIKDSNNNTLYENGTITKVSNNEYAYVVTNTRKTAPVSLKKIVSGNMGDRSAEFTFTYVVTGKNNEPIASGTVIRKHGYSDTQNMLGQFPIGATVTITEGSTDGYTTTMQLGSGTANKTNTVTFTLSESGNTVTFENNKEVIVDTGVPMTTSPYLFLLGLIPLAGVGAILMARKRRRDEA